ncbi:ABC transporter ATP-binding protein YtrB [Clostridium acetireducens DSM 10703]|uniref:ABC transporter ATP-binding protein YtrB n=1 Tax=Clostridium acetireducens DSM 10703 TaxID=1121290 RepID=A0A1E8F160_9CLOT|nr:ABC transporter ATP-binding protein [Clostridium acetireducens]OFI07074.1 ABC transporter ATP-binding protein YtrB [Clostridium acetireducens DSM 10703]
MENILEIKNLRKEYKNFVLKDINFNLPKGYIMGFIGPNGAGKSTTIKLIMNLIKKNSGEIKVFGLDNIKHEKEIKNRIGFVYDENYYYEDLKINEIRKIIKPFYSNWSDDTFNKYIKDFNLDVNAKVKTLSKGMKTKFSLAVALSHNAELIIMDEPTAGLDPIFRREILDILYDLIQNEEKSVFFSTHITTDLEKIADYITFINDGEIVFSKEKDDIMENYALIKGSNDILNEENKKDFIAVRKNRFGFEALTDKKEFIAKKYKDDVIIERPTLEDIMLFIVKGDKYV